MKLSAWNQFEWRRIVLQESMHSNQVLVLESGQEKIRNGNANYRFRTNSDFLYLTGLKEPNCAIIIEKNKTTLFVREKDESQERWHGARMGTVVAKLALSVDECYDIEHKSMHDFYSKSQKSSKDVKDALHRMRSVKDSAELEKIKKATDISVYAHHRAIRLSTFKESENSLQAIFDGKFTSSGVEHAYTPIVASGSNALCFHYIQNNQKIKPGDMVLIDAGCEYEGYASDITRTFPADGKFTQQQAELYEIVLDANKKTIDFVTPGVTLSEVDEVARTIVCDGLTSLGYKDPNKYFPHGTSHFLGLDVHDVGDRNAPLRNGNVITVEPGVYIPELGLGIRIEDDIAVTADDNINLTEDLIKEISDIEEVILCPIT